MEGFLENIRQTIKHILEYKATVDTKIQYLSSCDAAVL